MSKIDLLPPLSHDSPDDHIDIPGFPEVSTHLLTDAPRDLRALRKFHKRNANFFMNGGGINIASYAKALEQGNPDGARFYGAWSKGKLIAAVVMTPYAERQVEIAGAVDMKHTRKGLALAAARTLIEHENENGFDVVAEVEHRNVPNVEPLLHKLGFIEEDETNDGRYVYTAMSEQGILERLYR